MKKKEFFRNFIAIMLFGVVGVFISCAIISSGKQEILSVDSSPRACSEFRWQEGH